MCLCFFFFFLLLLFFCFVFFFFQAEDGIRDRDVTGVQTCALPIYSQNPRTGGVDEVLQEDGLYLDAEDFENSLCSKLREISAMPRAELQRRGTAIRRDRKSVV